MSLPKDIEKIKDQPTVFVIFGATGDLARKKLFPALFKLHQTKFLPHEFRIIATSRTHHSNEKFHQIIKESTKPKDLNDWQKFTQNIEFIAADIAKNAKSKDVLEHVQEFLASYDVPIDFQVVLSGKAREVRENFKMIIFAFVLSTFLVYMIMAAQFESFTHPFIVMLTVPNAMLGVALAHLLTRTPVSVISLLGVLILAGTVVNNSIVLVDFINRSRRQGVELVEACVMSAMVRLRPILLSTITTVVGLIPLALALGEGAELMSPLAIVVVGGLLSATFFTIVVLPSVYVLVTRLSARFLVTTDFEDPL